MGKILSIIYKGLIAGLHGENSLNRERLDTCLGNRLLVNLLFGILYLFTVSPPALDWTNQQSQGRGVYLMTLYTLKLGNLTDVLIKTIPNGVTLPQYIQSNISCEEV